MSDPSALPFRLPPPAGDTVDLLVVAGEHSGDEHAASMVAEVLHREPACRIAALGGPRLQAAGAQLLHDLTATSVVGIIEVLRHYSFFRALFREVLRWIETHRPRAVCLVDYPGFNLRLAQALRDRGLSAKGGGPVRLVYYISPQVWAWKSGRRFAMARNLDALAVIFPFEVETYADTGLTVEFVGHPFVAPGYVSPVHYDPEGPVLLLPGSRRQAVGRIFPAILAGFLAFGEREAVVLYPSEEMVPVLRASNPPSSVRLQPFGGNSVGACAVLTSSGTMSMHCALAGIPGAIAYRANPITYLLGRWLVKVPYLGIANLLLDDPMYPEFIQGAATAEALARELRDCVSGPGRRDRARELADRLRQLLMRPASGTAADWLMRQTP